MTFKKWSLAIATLMLVAPLSASALGISIAGVSSTGGDPNQLGEGDVITFDLVLENATSENVLALGLGVYGYDTGAQGDPTDNRLVFAGGSAAGSVLNLAFNGGAPLAGIQGVGGVIEEGIPFPISQTLRVSLFEGANLAGTTGDGTLDLGVGGGQTNGADVHFQVSFSARSLGNISPSDITLEFGVGQFGNAAITADGSQLAFNNATYTVNVVPEPGTALLMGLGLAGLAARRR